MAGYRGNQISYYEKTMILYRSSDIYVCIYIYLYLYMLSYYENTNQPLRREDEHSREVIFTKMGGEKAYCNLKHWECLGEDGA